MDTKVGIGKILLGATIIINMFWDILVEYYKYLPHILLLVVLLIYIAEYKTCYIKPLWVILLVYILLHGVVNSKLGNDRIIYMLLQTVVIAVNYLVYSNVLRNISINQIMSVYWKSAYVMGWIAVCQEIFGIMGFANDCTIPVIRWFLNYFGAMTGGLVRVKGICQESSFLGYYLAPAMCICLFYVVKKYMLPEEFKKVVKKKHIIIIMLAYLFSFSAVAYFGVAVVFLLLLLTENKFSKKVLVIAGICIISVVVYINIPAIRLRVDDTIAVFRGADLNEVNLSSYTYYMAYTVAKKSLRYTSFMGAGIGSSATMYDKFSFKGWGGQELILNAEDANSMLFRIIIEFGVVGIIVLAIFLKKNFVRKGSTYFVFSLAILTLFSMILLRQGNYTHAGFMMYVYLYNRIAKESNHDKRMEIDKERQE